MVVGAGLAGLSAARDLAAGGADVVVLEARERPGGRVEQELLPDGRPVQYGGEVVADWMDAYVGLVAELGLTLEPSYTALDLPPAWGADEGVAVAERAPWMDEADRANLVRVEAEFAALSRGVDPGNPWSHPDAAKLDSLSVGAWLRSVGARPGVTRLLDHMARSLSIDSIERTSLLAQLRKEAAAGGHGFYDERRWEHLRVAEGSATVALLMADELGERVRLGSVVVALGVTSSRCTAFLRDGEADERPAPVARRVPHDLDHTVRVITISTRAAIWSSVSFANPSASRCITDATSLSASLFISRGTQESCHLKGLRASWTSSWSSVARSFLFHPRVIWLTTFAESLNAAT